MLGTDKRRKPLTMIEKRCGTFYPLKMAEMRNLIIVKMYLLCLQK